MNKPASAALPNTAPSLRNDKLAIGGMRCSACCQIIEFRLRQLKGVSAFHVNSVSQRADISWNPTQISLREIVESIADLGYSALPEGQGDRGGTSAQEAKMRIWRLFVAGFAMMQVMMYAFPAYLEPVPQIDGDLTPDIDHLLKLASLALTLPVVGFSAWPFFVSAWRDVRNRHIGMDVPVSLGIAATFLASIWSTFAGGPVYYDSLIMFVFLLLGARWLEAKVQTRSSAALRELMLLVPVLAQRCIDYPHSRQTEAVNGAQLRVGDVVLIAPGAQIPVDGLVLEGDSESDEALMTGESRPVPKTIGARLIAGALNLSGPLIVRAERVGDDTELSSLVKTMAAAANEKPPLVQIADRHASRFLSAILLLALAAGMVWWHIDSARALWIAVTVMVITCPCALSLATPGVMSAAIGQLARRGVLVARGKAIETLARASHIVFDKTGTLTLGRLTLVDKVIYRQSSPHFESGELGELGESSELGGEAALLALTAALANGSNHPVAQALRQVAVQGPRLEPEVCDLREIAGCGIEASYRGMALRLGKLEFVQGMYPSALPMAAAELPARFAGKTLAALGNAEGLLALFALQDGLRPDARELLDFLRSKGKHLLLLSGDRADVVASVADELALDPACAIGDLRPDEKYAVVRDLQRQGAIVAMIGDGLNDGPVLSIANVSIAMGQGAPISQARSDLVLISNRLGDLKYAVGVTSLALVLIRQNIIWAVCYNLLAIPAALAGILAPWHAAIGMSLSSLIVVGNSLRIFLFERHKITNPAPD